MPNVQQVKHRMRNYLRDNGLLSGIHMNLKSPVWGLGARRAAWRVTKKATGKPSTRKARVIPILWKSKVKLPAKAIDASTNTIGYINRIKAKGITTVIRYVGQPYWPKNLKKDEAKALLRAGVNIGFVYETSAGWMAGGHNAGVKAAKDSRSHIVSYLGTKEDDWVLYLACDTDTLPNSTVVSCLNGAASVLGKNRVGLYGGYGAIAAAKRAGYKHLWQTTAWSYGKRVKGINLFQYYGGNHFGNLGFSYDGNDQFTVNIGAWGE